MAFLPAITPPLDLEKEAWWFLFHKNELLVGFDGETPQPLLAADPETLGLEPQHIQYLGSLHEAPCFAAELPESQDLPEGYEYRSLRELFLMFPDDFHAITNHASQIITWAQTHQFCGRCGTATVQKTNERAAECPSCKLVSYPRISPSIIVAVTKGDQILLGRSPHWRAGWYSVLAGFVEAGETLEACVQREVMEEVGIEVKNIQYFGSQPWPFPHSLMIGFTAEYAGGEITPDPVEIEDAAWFTKDNLPNLPSKISIARRLLDWYLNDYLPN